MPFLMDSFSAFSESLNPDPSLPIVYWNQLNQEDKDEFIRLRTSLHQSQKQSNTVKDSRLMTFSNEMKTILKFIEHDESGRQQRSILTGVAFAGPFICVNTRQLKNFLGRCKSSINGSLQQLGYIAVKTKSKARSCVLAVMPLLTNDVNLLRQWTVRGASEDALFCFVSSFHPNQLPLITAEDLNEDRRNTVVAKISNAMISSSLANKSKDVNKSTSATNGKQNSKSKASNANSTSFQTPQQTIQNIIKHVLLNVPQKKLNIINNSNNSNIDMDISVPVTDFKSPDMFNFGLNYDLKPFEMTPSISVDYLHKFGDGFGNDFENDIFNDYENEWNIQSHRTVPRSNSTFFSTSYDWKLPDDPQLFF